MVSILTINDIYDNIKYNKSIENKIKLTRNDIRNIITINKKKDNYALLVKKINYYCYSLLLDDTNYYILSQLNTVSDKELNEDIFYNETIDKLYKHLIKRYKTNKKLRMRSNVFLNFECTQEMERLLLIKNKDDEKLYFFEEDEIYYKKKIDEYE